MGVQAKHLLLAAATLLSFACAPPEQAQNATAATRLVSYTETREPCDNYEPTRRALFGDLHAYGPDGVRFYTRKKAVTQRWPQRASHEAAQFAFPSNN